MASSQTYRKHASRWGTLTLFALSSGTNAVLWLSFSPIVSHVQLRFDVSNLAANMLSLVFLILYAPGTVLAVFLMERFGLRVCLATGAVLNAVSAWLRYAGCFPASLHGGFAVLMAGQCLGALVQPIFTNLPSRIAGDWFPVSERDLATVVGAMSNQLGNAVASVVPSLIVSTADDLPWLLLYEAAWATVIGAFVLAFARDRPPSPPSAAAEIRLLGHTAMQSAVELEGAGALVSSSSPLPVLIEAAIASRPCDSGPPLLTSTGDQVTVDPSRVPIAAPPVRDLARQALAHMLHDFGALLKNANYLRLMLAFGIGVGVFNALLTVMASLLGPCGYGADSAGYAGGALLLAGLAGAGVMGVVMERTKAYVPLLKVAIVAVVAATLFMLASLKPGNEAQAIASWGVLGFCLLPLLPLSLENAAEATYPIHEDNSSGLLLLVGQWFGIVFIVLFTYVLSIPPSSDCSSVASPIAGVILGVVLVAAGGLLFFKRDYRRQHAETQRMRRAVDGPPAIAAFGSGVAV